MNYGLPKDVMVMTKALGEECLRQVLQHAEAGGFHDQEWRYWHTRFGGKPEALPALPKRRFDW
jgi:hypothetical protein